MTLLTDVDIRKALGKDIVIEPFLEDLLTPVGYDFTVGDFVFSLEKGLLEQKDGVYHLPPKSTIQILTKESLWVSDRIGGTFHSKVSLVSKGLSHISTTLDPGWYGPLLITLRNNMDREIPIKTDDAFVTLIFFKVLTPTQSKHMKPAFRKDILISQLNHQTENYIKKIQSIFKEQHVLRQFEIKVEEANESNKSKISDIQMKKILKGILNKIGVNIINLSIISLIIIPFYGNWIQELFSKINYDTSIFTVQVVAIIALLSLRISIRKNK